MEMSEKGLLRESDVLSYISAFPLPSSLLTPGTGPPPRTIWKENAVMNENYTGVGRGDPHPLAALLMYSLGELSTDKVQRCTGTLSPQLPAVSVTLPTASRGPDQLQLLGAQSAFVQSRKLVSQRSRVLEPAC